MEDKKTVKKNLWMYPIGSVGRDMVYQLFNSFILTYVLLTRTLTAAQLGAITAIMIAARVFDAVNDPVMGIIVEKTKSRFGKFKPWLVAGMISTAAVVITIFNTHLQGWDFIVLFGVIYFLYSITYTMHDISFWGMIPAMSSDADTRNMFTSRAVLFAGVGSTLAGMLIPMLTVGGSAIAGNAQDSYGIVAIAISVISLVFICFTIFGVKENSAQNVTAAQSEHKGIKGIVQTIVKNKPLLWIVVAFLFQQIGNNVIIGGVGSTYIYFQYGYEGGKYSLFSTVGVSATAVLMVAFPMVSRKTSRKALMKMMLIVAMVGYILMLATGFVLTGTDAGYWILTMGYMLSNFGQYGFYLVMMISILNTVEYNEYISGQRDEAVIASVRPFITKMASALVVGFTSLSYILLNVTEKTNAISALEQEATAGSITEAEKLQKIQEVIGSIGAGQNLGLLMTMVILPCVMLIISYVIYQQKYTLDEAEYDRICDELAARREK